MNLTKAQNQKTNITTKAIKLYSNEWRKLKKNRHNDDYFLNHNIHDINYKKTIVLRKFINRQGRIITGVFNKLTSRNQRLVAKAIKRARQMALLPYTIINQNE